MKIILTGIRPFVFLFILYATAYSQSINNTDSLTHAYKTSVTKKDKLEILSQLALAELYSNEALAYAYAQEALSLAQVIQNKKGIADACYLIGVIKANQQDFDSVIFFQTQAYAHYQHLNDSNKMARCLNELGIAYEYKGNYKESIEYYFKSLRVAEQLHDETGIVNELNNIGLIYQYQKQYTQADTYFRKSLMISEKIKYEKGTANAWNNMATNYQEQGLLDKALVYMSKVLEFDIRSGDKKNIAGSYNNVAIIFYQLKQYHKAIEYYNLSEKIKLEINDYTGLANTYNNIADVYISINNYNEALKYINRSVRIANQHNFNSSYQESYYNYYKLYKQKGDYQKALEYYQKYIDIRDSILAKENSLAIAKLQSGYDLEKAKREIGIKAEQIKSEQRIFQLVLLGAVILFLLSVVLLFSFLSKRKLNKQLKLNQDEIVFQNKLLKRKNIEVEKSRQDAEEAAKAKSQFLSVMSHEIRTPINAIIGITHLLEWNEPREDQRENINILKISSQNLLDLVNDVLDLSKLEAGKVELEKIDFNFINLIKNSKEMFALKAIEKGLELKLNIDPKIPPIIKGDPLRLNQILNNLIGNAIKFTEKGSVVIDVKQLDSAANWHRLQFSVTDTGIGIPQNKQQEIFESFIQAENSTTRKYGGTGLGLSICKKLLEMSKSKLELQSEEGKGSCFSFIIIFEQASSSKNNHEIPINHPLLEGKRMLIAEDNPVNVAVLRQFLKKWKVEKDFAKNGQEAVDKLKIQEYDIILMDIHMPELDGLQAVQIIRNELKITTPIIALTATYDDEIRMKVIEVGMNEFIVKPFNPTDLYEKIILQLKA